MGFIQSVEQDCKQKVIDVGKIAQIKRLIDLINSVDTPSATWKDVNGELLCPSELQDFYKASVENFEVLQWAEL